MTLTLIAAMAENRVIGANGQLPWHLPEDLKRFRQATIGKAMIMGRVTYDSIGRVLPGRETVILSRKSVEAPGCHLAHSWAEGLEIAKRLSASLGADDIPIVGGEQIYSLAMPYADRILLTIVHRDVPGDARFPGIPEKAFSLASSEESQVDGTRVSYLEYLKIQ